MTYCRVVQMTNEQIQEIFENEKLRITDIATSTPFGDNLWNYYQFVSWARWLNKNNC